MTNEEFNAWRQHLAITFKAAAGELGVSERSVYGYAKDMEIPLYIERACRDIEREYNEKKEGWALFRKGDLTLVANGLTKRQAEAISKETGLAAAAEKEAALIQDLF